MDYRKEAIECVKDCVLSIHQQIYAKYDGDFDRIYSEGYNSKSYQGSVIEPGKVYELSYLECSCPKVKCGLRSNPEQCECSRQSILFILSQLEPDSQFDVQIVNTILRGGERCTFRITRHAGINQSEDMNQKKRTQTIVLLAICSLVVIASCILLVKLIVTGNHKFTIWFYAVASLIASVLLIADGIKRLKKSQK